MTPPDFQITNFRLSDASAPPEWSAVAYFDIVFPGIEIKRCRLVRCKSGLSARGPAFDRKRNRQSFGQVNFRDATYRAIVAAAVAIFQSMGGQIDPEAGAEDGDPVAPVLLFTSKRAASYG